MARIDNLTNFLNDVSSAIKQKIGDSAPILASEFDTKIAEIETRGNYQQKSVTISNNGTQIFTPDANYDAIEQIEITTNVPILQLQTKSVEITSNGNISVLPDTEYDGMSQIDLTVNVPSQDSGNTLRIAEIYQYLDFNLENLNTLSETYAGYINNAELDKTYVHCIYFSVPTHNTIDTSGSTIAGVPRNGVIRLFDIWPHVLQVDIPVESTINTANKTFIYFNPTYTNAFIQLDSAYGVGLVDNWLSLHPEETLNTLKTLSGWYEELGDTNNKTLTPTVSVPRIHAIIIHNIDVTTMQDMLLGNDDQTNYMNLSDINNAISVVYYTKETGEAEPDNINNTNNYDSLIRIASGMYVLDVMKHQTNPALKEHILDGHAAFCSIGLVEGTLTQNVTNTFDDTNAEAYSKIQKVYNNMTPLIATNNNKRAGLSTNIKIIPSKSDGTSLLDTSNVTNMNNMFQSCGSLVAISLLNTSNVVSMSCMFNACKSLSFIPLLDTSKVTDMGQMFQGCTSLTTIPQLDTSSVTDMYSIFGNCTSLSSIPLLDTSSVTNMQNMFNNCSSLVSIPLLDTSKVTDVSNMFQGCTSLTTIPQLDTSNVINAAFIFGNCSALETVPLLNMSNVTNMHHMFYNCSSLSNTSLNNILQMCVNATSYTRTKTLAYLGLTSTQATTCQSLSNYSAFTSAGWTTGY